MSDLAVVAYKGEDTADQALNKLTEMQREYLVDLEDADVVIRDKKGNKQLIPLVRDGALGGAAWGGWTGALAGILLLQRLGGVAAASASA